jgi:putative GTP pyrophosphokinase
VDTEGIRRAYTERFAYLEDMARRLEALTRDALADFEHLHIDRVSFRAKAVASFMKKAQEPKTGVPYLDPLAEIEDQIGGRVLVFFRHDIDLVNELLRRKLRGVEFKRVAPDAPDSFGYESDHWICLIPLAYRSDEWQALARMPTTFELQVRTLFMHAWAEPEHNIGYKPNGKVDPEITRRLAWVAASSWGADNMLDELLLRLPSPEDA